MLLVDMGRDDISARDRGLALIPRINRWLIAGAVGLAGVLSVAAANAFHGHQRTQSSQAGSGSSAVQQQQSSTPGSSTGDGGGSGSLQQPAQTPSSAPGSASGGVVSGGS
jgi:hypothetical protein